MTVMKYVTPEAMPHLILGPSGLKLNFIPDCLVGEMRMRLKLLHVHAPNAFVHM